MNSCVLHTKFALAAAVALAALSPALIWAQAQAINGSIRGRVTDPAASPIAQADVKIENTGTGLERSVQTTEDGYYVFPNLPLGSYTVTIQKTGFQTQRASRRGSQCRPRSHNRRPASRRLSRDLRRSHRRRAHRRRRRVSAPAEPSATKRRTICRSPRAIPITSSSFNPASADTRIPSWASRVFSTPMAFRIASAISSMAPSTPKPTATVCACSPSPTATSAKYRRSPTASRRSSARSPATSSTSSPARAAISFTATSPTSDARSIWSHARFSPRRPHSFPIANDFAANAGVPIIKNKLFFFGSYEHVERSVPAPITITPANAAADRNSVQSAHQPSGHRTRAVGRHPARLGHHAEASVLRSLQLLPQSVPV